MSMLPTRTIVMAVLAVALSAVVINLAASFLAENIFPFLENTPGVLGEMVSMLRMHNSSPMSSSLLVAAVAALACLICAPIMADALKKSAKAAGV